MNVKNNNQNYKPDYVGWIFDEFYPKLVDLPFDLIDWSFNKFKKKKDNRIILGTDESNKEYHTYPVERNEHTLISGEPGVGKSLLIIKTARQTINLGIRTCVIDPGGDAVKHIWQVVKDTSNIVFYSLNEELQKDYKLGFNPFYFISEDLDKLNQHISDLKDIIFPEQALEIPIKGDFLLTSIVFFHNCLPFYYLEKGVNPEEIENLLLEKQINFKDIELVVNEDFRFFDLMAEVLNTKCPFQRTDLAVKWIKYKEDKKQLNYLMQASKRFYDYTKNVESSYLLESSGLNILEDLKQNKSVLLDLKTVSPKVNGLISSLILSKLARMHKKKILKGQTDLIIDEAKTLTIPTLEEIITECRKDNLAVTLAFQFVGQFNDQPKTKLAIESAICHTCEFKNEKGAVKEIDFKDIRELPKFKFIYRHKGAEGNVKKLLKVDITPIIREFDYEPKGLKKSIIQTRRLKKLNNIYEYFTTF
jgi:hypothetical protein